MICPAAAAQRLTIRLGQGVMLSMVLALAQAWIGIALAFYTDWPCSFWITALGALIYLLTVVPMRRALQPASWISTLVRKPGRQDVLPRQG